MANSIGYYLVPNATATAAEARYLIRIVPNGTCTTDDILADLTGSINTTGNRARMAWDEAVRVAIEHARRGESVDLGFGRMKCVIPGSMPCEDTPFREGIDELVIEFYADAQLSGVFAGFTPVKLSAEDLERSIRVSNIMDTETEEFSFINGYHDFLVLGNGVTLDGEGEGAKLLDRKTGEEVCTCTVKSVSKGQRATCQIPADAEIEDGNYTIEIATRGLIGAETARVFRKPVRYRYVAPPTVITTVAPASGDPGTTKSGVCMNIAGGELLMGDGDICKVRGVKNGESVEFTFTKADMTVNSNTMVTTALPKALAAHCFDADSKCYWSVKGSAEFETTYLDS